MTLSLCGLMLALVLVMRLAPQSLLARLLHRQLVELPLRWLAGLERHQLIFVLIMTAFAAGGVEAIAVLGPEMVAGYAIDLAIYLDALAVTYALAALAQLRAAARAVRWRLKRLAMKVARRRRRAQRRVRSRPQAANDDEDDARPLAA